MNDPTFVQLHPDIARRTRPSCTLLLDRRTEFTAEFHSNLVELMPDVQVIAQPPGTKISQSLVDCVLWATFATDSPVVVGNTLQDIGLGLHRSGFPREGYQSVGHALLRTVRRMYPMDWSGGMSSAWIGYHAWLCDHWMRGALASVIEDQDRVATNDMDAPATREAPPEAPGREGRRLSYGEILVAMTFGVCQPDS